MIYLGQPYSSLDPYIRRVRYEEGLRATASLFIQGHTVYAPIVHWYKVAIAHKLPHDAASWRRVNFEFIELSSALYILQIEGWKQSIGLKEEVAHALSLKKALFLMQPIDSTEYKILSCQANILTEFEAAANANFPKRDAG